MGRWDNEIVWVTGASSGIGQACAEAWAQKGATVVLSARKKDTLEKVAAPLRDQGAKVHVVTLDLADITVSNDGSRTEEELGFPGV